MSVPGQKMKLVYRDIWSASEPIADMCHLARPMINEEPNLRRVKLQLLSYSGE